MNKIEKDFKIIFDIIKKTGPHKSLRKGPTGIGYTFEELLDKEEDNLSLPDFGDIEIKSRDQASKSMITLFTKSPDFPKGANTYLREKYGYMNEKNNLILHTTLNAKEFNSSTDKSTGKIYNYKVVADRDNEEILIFIKDEEGKLENIKVGWYFSTLKKAINLKLKKIAVVSANKIIIDEEVYYDYTSVQLIENLVFENFLQAIEDGALQIDIRIGVYNSGKNKGKTHDHGTGFRIHFNKLINYVDAIDFC